MRISDWSSDVCSSDLAIQNADEMQEQFGDIEYREQDGRVWLVFPGKPADDVRATLRSRGFKWSPTRGAWVRQLSEAARYYGRQTIGSESCRERVCQYV